MNTNEILFRCSSLGHLMKEPKTKQAKEAGEIAETVKTHLIDVFISWYYKRREEVTSKYLEKGNAREEDSITLLTQNDNTMYRKNGKRLHNDFITGEPDLFTGQAIESAEETLDIKSSWSLHTFLRAKHEPLNPLYYWQGTGYMGLSNAKRHTVVYCLVNGTADQIMNEKRRASYEPGMLSFTGQESEAYKKRCSQIEINHIFDRELFDRENPGFEYHFKGNWIHDIDPRDRMFKKTFERNDNDINEIYYRVVMCRKWIGENLLNQTELQPA